MELQEILKALRNFNGQFPHKAVLAARCKSFEITPLLMANLEHTRDNYKQIPRHDIAHIFSVFLLAEFRCVQAFPLILSTFSLPGNWSQKCFGDTFLSFDAANILASTYHDNFTALRFIIEDPSNHEYVRCMAIEAVMALLATKQLARAEVLVYFQSLLTPDLKQRAGVVWAELVAARNEIQAGQDKSNSPYHLINDVVAEMGWWTCFQYPHGFAYNDEKYDLDPHSPIGQPHQWPHPRMSWAAQPGVQDDPLY